MSLKPTSNSVLAFSLSLTMGLSAVFLVFVFNYLTTETNLPSYYVENGVGIGAIESLGSDYTRVWREKVQLNRVGENGVFVHYIPRPLFTDAATKNGVSGRVLLRVSLLSDGTVGRIDPTETLPHGLTENAISAASEIVFDPETIDGVAVSRDVFVSYRFRGLQ